MRFSYNIIAIVAITATAFAVDKFVTPDKLPSVNQKLEPIPDAGVPSPITAGGCKPGCNCNRPGCNCGEVIAAAGCQAGVEWNVPAIVMFRESQPADVIEMYAPKWCSTCPGWKALLGKGDGLTKIDWIQAEFPFPVANAVYPMAYHRKSNTYTPGDKLPKTMDGIRAKFGLKPKPSTHLSAINAGKIDKKWVDGVVRLMGEAGSVQLGNAAYQDKFGIAVVSVPANFHAAWSTSGGKTVATFSNQPLVKLAVIEQKLDGVSWDGKNLTLMIPWMPDLVLTTESHSISQSTPRSPDWPRVRREHLALHPVCEACGGTEEINVHHVIPFHTDHSKELDPTNLITLCRKHHWEIGHDPDGLDGSQKPNWSAANRNVRADAEATRKRLDPK